MTINHVSIKHSILVLQIDYSKTLNDLVVLLSNNSVQHVSHASVSAPANSTVQPHKACGGALALAEGSIEENAAINLSVGPIGPEQHSVH